MNNFGVGERSGEAGQPQGTRLFSKLIGPIARVFIYSDRQTRLSLEEIAVNANLQLAAQLAEVELE